jgi:hypothetical protein
VITAVDWSNCAEVGVATDRLEICIIKDVGVVSLSKESMLPMLIKSWNVIISDLIHHCPNQKNYINEINLMTKSHFRIFSFILFNSIRAILVLIPFNAVPVMALPRPDDLPEEYLRTQIIFEARSPITGEILTAADYAELLTSLDQEFKRQENTNFTKPYREALFLLRLRKLIKSVGIPIK